MPTNLSLDSLHCFITAAELLNFRAAARVAALTPAALGQRIASLEHELGAPLFIRTTRRVALTPEGLALVPFARTTLDAARQCYPQHRSPNQQRLIECVIGTRHELGMSWLLPAFAKLRQALPHITLHLYVGAGPDLLARLQSGALDVAVTSTQVVNPRLTSLELHPEHYWLVAHPRLLLRQPLRHAAQAKDHTLIDLSPELPLFRYFREAPGGFASMHFGRTLHLGAIAAVRHQTTAGQGIAVLPSYYVREDVARGRLVRVLPRITLRSDAFRLIFRTGDARADDFRGVANVLAQQPLR